MKKFIFLVIFPLVGFTQEETQSNQFSVYVTPEINGMKISSSELAQVYKLSTKSMSAFSIGLNWDRNIKSKFSLRTGIGYGYKRCFHEIGEWEIVYDPTIGVLDATMQRDFKFHELQIPLLLKYGFNEKWFVTAGFETNFVLINSSEGVTIASDGYREPVDPSFNVGINVAPSLSAGYYIPKIKLSIEPQLNYYLRRNMAFQSNFYRYGIKISYKI